MITLESIAPGLLLTGLDPTGNGSVVAVVPIADGAVQILYKTADGDIKERLLNRADESNISISTTERPWSFDGDGEAFKLTVEAKRKSPADCYIQSVTFNGRPYHKVWFRHADIARGGTFVFQMGPRPNRQFGADAAAAPPSLTP